MSSYGTGEHQPPHFSPEGRTQAVDRDSDRSLRQLAAMTKNPLFPKCLVTDLEEKLSRLTAQSKKEMGLDDVGRPSVAPLGAAPSVELGSSFEQMNFSSRARESVEMARSYLNLTEGRYEPGDDRFFGRLALQSAVRALFSGNYPIGAVAVVREGDIVRVYSGENSLVSGDKELESIYGPFLKALTQSFGHAEMTALMRSLCEQITPDLIVSAWDNEKLATLPEGLTMFGTLEPCPMCTTAMTADRRTVRSVSNAADPLGAYVINEEERQAHQPKVQTWIQDKRGLKFEQLQGDQELATLSSEIFHATREDLDRFLATKKAPPSRRRRSGLTDPNY